MGASLPFSRSFATSVDIWASQKRSSVRLPEALRPRASAIRRSASRVRRGGAFAGGGGLPYFFRNLGVTIFSPPIPFLPLPTPRTPPSRHRPPPQRVPAAGTAELLGH